MQIHHDYRACLRYYAQKVGPGFGSSAESIAARRENDARLERLTPATRHRAWNWAWTRAPRYTVRFERRALREMPQGRRRRTVQRHYRRLIQLALWASLDDVDCSLSTSESRGAEMAKLEALLGEAVVSRAEGFVRRILSRTRQYCSGAPFPAESYQGA